MRNRHGISAAAQRVITPDFSMYRDMPLIERQCNNYRSDAIGHSWQQNSLIAVPDVRWDADELSMQLVTECRGAQPSPSERSFVSKTRQMGKSSHQPYISSSRSFRRPERLLSDSPSAANKETRGHQQNGPRNRLKTRSALDRRIGFSDGKLH